MKADRKLQTAIFVCAILSGVCFFLTGCGTLGIGGDDKEMIVCPSAYRQPVKDHFAIVTQAFANHGMDFKLKKRVVVSIKNVQPSGLPLEPTSDGNGCAYIAQVGKWAGATTTDKLRTTYYIYAGTAIPPGRLNQEAARAILFSEGVSGYTEQMDYMKRAGVWGYIIRK